MPIATAIALLLSLIDHASTISALIKEAQASGRTDLSPEEWTSITSSDDAAHAALLMALKA